MVVGLGAVLVLAVITEYVVMCFILGSLTLIGLLTYSFGDDTRYLLVTTLITFALILPAVTLGILSLLPLPRTCGENPLIARGERSGINPNSDTSTMESNT
jgi:hypothetical protein